MSLTPPKFEDFAVKSNSFELYDAFRKEVEKIGYKHNAAFNPWDYNMFSTRNGVYFSLLWNHIRQEVPKFSFTSVGSIPPSFDLTKEWKDALKHAQEMYDLFLLEKNRVPGVYKLEYPKIVTLTVEIEGQPKQTIQL